MTHNSSHNFFALEISIPIDIDIEQLKDLTPANINNRLAEANI